MDTFFVIQKKNQLGSAHRFMQQLTETLVPWDPRHSHVVYCNMSSLPSPCPSLAPAVICHWGRAPRGTSSPSHQAAQPQPLPAARGTWVSICPNSSTASVTAMRCSQLYHHRQPGGPALPQGGPLPVHLYATPCHLKSPPICHYHQLGLSGATGHISFGHMVSQHRSWPWSLSE